MLLQKNIKYTHKGKNQEIEIDCSHLTAFLLKFPSEKNLNIHTKVCGFYASNEYVTYLIKT